MLFNDIIGYDDIKRQLIQTATTGRISHAQLLSGASGAGAYPLALAYATYIMCRNKGLDDACGVCPECYKMNRLEHPDLHLVFPVNDAKTSSTDKPTSDKYITQWREFITQTNSYFNISQWYQRLGIENKQGIIRKEEANEIVRKMSLKSFEGGYKIVIVCLPETMRDEASNTLLKLLEEPPAKTLFLLVTDQPDKIIGTIRSRTQELKIPALNDELIAKNIAGKFNLPTNEASQIAHSAMGSWGLAIQMVEEQQNSELYENFIALMRLCYVSNYLGIFQWVETIAPLGREFHKSFCHTSLTVLRNCYVQGIGMSQINFCKPGQSDFINRFAPFVNNLTIEQFIEEYELLLRDISQNGNTKIVFTHFALTLCKVFAQAKKQLQNA